MLCVSCVVCIVVLRVVCCVLCICVCVVVVCCMCVCVCVWCVCVWCGVVWCLLFVVCCWLRFRQILDSVEMVTSGQVVGLSAVLAKRINKTLETPLTCDKRCGWCTSLY